MLGWVFVYSAVYVALAYKLFCVHRSGGGSFEEIELSRLSLAKPAKVKLTNVLIVLSRLSWTRSPRKANVHSRLTHS